MGALANFFDWLAKAFLKATTALMGFGGLFTLAITSAIATVASLFTHFTYFDDLATYVDQATQWVSTVMASANQGVVMILYDAIALDRLIQFAVFLAGATIGVTFAVFITLFVALLALIPSILICKAVCRAIKVATLGFLEP